MNAKRVLVIGAAVAVLMLGEHTAWASPGRRLVGTAARAAVRGRAASSVLARDLRNHKITRARILARARMVFRYTSRGQAAREARQGIRPFNHMTSTGGPGRPMSGRTAVKTFGLRRAATARETIRLGKGTPVILNNAQGGARGRGELVSPTHIPPLRVIKVVPLTHSLRRGGRVR